MGLETGNTIADLNPSWPLGSDLKSEGDDHIRLIKTVISNDCLPKSGGTMTGALAVEGASITIKNTSPSWPGLVLAQGNATQNGAQIRANYFDGTSKWRLAFGGNSDDNFELRGGPSFNLVMRADTGASALQLLEAGQVRIGHNNANFPVVVGGSNGATLTADGRFAIYGAASPLYVGRSTAGSLQIFYCGRDNIVGGISVTTTATTYATSSDYRLKENIRPITDALRRVAALKPVRFNFKSEPQERTDGFIAHEAQAVVPGAVTGQKDDMDADGNPIYQGIDQSKLVPLLVAAVQELTARVAALEAGV